MATHDTIRLVSLNAMGGRVLDPLMDFFRRQAARTDIFCLQEVFDTDQDELDRRHPGERLRADLFRMISAALPDFEGTFAAFDDNPHRQSLAAFVRRTLPVRTITDFVVYAPERPQETGSAVISKRKLQCVTVDRGDSGLLIANFHGLWNGGGKTDTPERLEQSRRVKEHVEKHGGSALVCGDFNLLPDTESVRIIEGGMRNLVKETGVKSTRTPLYRHFDDPAQPNFADYVIVTPDLDVRAFEVMPDVVSDHAPLRVEFA